MKRPLKLLIAGLIVLVLGFFTIPSLFENWSQRPRIQHIEVQSSEKQVVHIATSNPKISVMVYESEGRSIVVVTQESAAIASQVMVEADEEQGVRVVNLFRKDHDATTVLDKPDRNGIPIRKMIKHGN